MARPERFELPTAWFVARYSIQLSYGRVSTCFRAAPEAFPVRRELFRVRCRSSTPDPLFFANQATAKALKPHPARVPAPTRHARIAPAHPVAPPVPARRATGNRDRAAARGPAAP